jgi:transcriptional regulator with XRE-family HTH domain
MSPFATAFRDLRVFCGMRQAEFATLLGYEQSYISAIELGSKGPPGEEFVSRLVERLNLDDTWQGRLLVALDESQRRIVLPNGASEDVYRLFNELRRQLETLHPVQLEQMKLALRLPASLPPIEAKPALPPRRSGTAIKKKVSQQ